MAKVPKQVKIERPKRVKLTREEVIRRMETLPERMDKLIAAIREGSRRNIHSSPP
jgi:hypothetical protein